MKGRIPLLVTCYWLLVILTGCGYTTRSMISSRFKTIYITPFVNKIDITEETDVASKYKIHRPLLDSDVTKAVINKFLFDGNLKPVKAQNADLTLKGEVIEIRKDPLRYDDNDEVSEYRVNIVVNISLWDNREDKMLWSENSFAGDNTYFTSGASATSEAASIGNAIADLARRVVERTVEEW